MAASIGLVVVSLLIACVHAEQAALQEQLNVDSDDLASQVRSLQQNVTDLWTYIYRLRQAIEVHLTDLTRRQSRMERSMQHVGGHDLHGHGHHTEDHSHGDPGHHHEPLTSSTDHHDDHSSPDHHHDDHSSSDHHHDDHSSSDHHHDDHGSSGHDHDDHGSSDQHHDDHHHDSHGDGGDHNHSEEHHGDYHDDHHHGHHSSSDSHTDDHSSHGDSDHSEEQGEHRHGDASQSVEDQQAAQDIERPFTATVVRSHHHHHTVATPDRATAQNESDPLNLLGGHSHSHHHHHHHHHSHQDPPQQTFDAKVTIPKYSDYRQYTFATCDVQPNRVISAELQQEVKGQVSFWQKKTGGPLNIHVRLRGFAIGDHHGHQQQQEQTNEAPVHGAGHRHGFHVHEFADLSAGCQSTGPHYNPLTVNHGGPKSSERHVGDLGNIECDDHGVTNIVFTDPVASLSGQYSIVGRALVIHSDVDDYGMNKDDPESLKTGNAGTRIACCVIQSVQKLPLATHKSIKLATNHQP